MQSDEERGQLTTDYIEAIREREDMESPQLPRFPPTVKYIVANEFCERFSFYGMRAILALYIKNALHLSATVATETVHLFIMASYFTPLIGAFISDSYLGKYTTILSLSVVYCVGNWALCFSAIESATTGARLAFYWTAAGLALVALGTGGIKPCVAPFGGEQVETSTPPGPARDALLRSFFSAFYFSINAGAALSGLLTPWLRTSFSYATAFSAPAWLMLLSVMLFVAGSKGYVHQPPSGNILSGVAKVVVSALRRKLGFWRNVTGAHYGVPANGSFRGTERPQEAGTEAGLGDPDAATANPNFEEAPLVPKSRERLFVRGRGRQKQAVGADETAHHSAGGHWLDAAKEEFHEHDVNKVKLVLRVLWLFLPAPLFWSLFDQQASRWVFQAEQMDGTLPLGLQIQPDQMQTLNSVLILVLIPLFDRGIYPALERFGLSLRPIRRMLWGMLFCAAAFVLSGLLQHRLDSGTSAPAGTSSAEEEGGSGPHGAQARVSMLWQVPQYVVMTGGEILFSITGLELAYSQAPPSMASMVTSGWLLTVAAGNLVTVLLVSVIGDGLTGSQEYFVFAAGCLLAMASLAWVGRGFVYVESVSCVLAGREDQRQCETGAEGEETRDSSTTGR